MSVTPASQLRIRPASVDDVDAVVEIGARTFRDTFVHDNDPDDLDLYVTSSFAPDKIAAELADPSSVFHLAYLEGDVVGYTKLRLGEVPECVHGPNPVELERIYLDQRVVGKGLGAALLRFCLETAREKGFKTLWLGVWEHNHRALAFYRKWGFMEVGSHEFVVGTDPQTDLIMERTLTDQSE